MSFWDSVQDDMKKNLKEGLDIFKEGSAAVSQKLEQLTDDGKKKYKVFNLNMKVQDEFTELGGQIYDLIQKKSKNPTGNKQVASIIKKIKKLEDEIAQLEADETRDSQKTKTVKKKTVRKKTTATKKTTARKKTTDTGTTTK
ncbi:hypothetical protein H8E50_02705 [bacterium]|nr:hypothetical protein [bacterium]